MVTKYSPENRAPSMLKSDLDEIVLSCSYDATGTKNFCSRVLSTLAVRHRQSYGRQFWYYATTVIEQALNKVKKNQIYCI